MDKEKPTEWDLLIDDDDELEEDEELDELEEDESEEDEGGKKNEGEWKIELDQRDLQYAAPAGYRVKRLPDGREIAQAYAYMESDKLYSWESPIYTLVREADIEPTPSLTSLGPVSLREALSPQAHTERVVKATLARERMGDGARSPMDMRAIASDLQREAQQEYQRWQREQEVMAIRKRETEQAVAQLLKIDISLVPQEHREALASLFRLKG
jgi:hypothetical protein